MENLEKKLLNECKNNCRIVACRFPLPSKKPLATVGSGVDTVWVYSLENKNFV